MLANGLQDQAVEILAISLTTDSEDTFKENSLMKLAGYGMSQRAAKEGTYNSNPLNTSVHQSSSMPHAGWSRRTA
jgi:hypothetical protein